MDGRFQKIEPEITGQAIAAKVIIEGQTLVIGSVYAPSSGEERVKIQKCIDKWKEISQLSMIGGDFNAVPVT